MSPHTPSILVVGAGAAGLMAAGHAAECGARVRLLEKMSQPGRKLSITGKGRCNVTNTAEVREFIDHFGRNGRFLRQAFSRFFSQELIDHLEALGVTMAYERGGRVFPQSGKATDVTAALVRWVKQAGVQIETGAAVDAIDVVDGAVRAVAVKGRRFDCRQLIVATGGSSYPRTGSTGDGYRMIKRLGHTVVPQRPALVPLVTGDTALNALEGLNLRNIGLTLWVDGKKKGEAFGEITFADYGLTGPLSLTFSGEIVELLDAGRQVEIELDLKPALDADKLDKRLLRDFDNRRKEPLVTLLGGLLPRTLIPFCLQQTQIPEQRIGQEVSAKERKRLRSWLKAFRLPVTGYRSMDEALVTAGGVKLNEVDPTTLESKRVKGLYLAGELLDLHADTGGYNLQAAFSTGWLAGQAAAEALQTNG